VVEPTQRPHYSLDELLAQCDVTAEISEEDRAWMESKPVGSELL
jgi:antitoxin ChpS